MTENSEKLLRQKLDREIKHGGYDISYGNVMCYTGKGGYIDSIVALHKAFDEEKQKWKEEGIWFEEPVIPFDFKEAARNCARGII